MDIVVTFLAGYQRFTMASSHDVNPCRSFLLSLALEIFQCSDMMDFDVLL